MWTTVCQQIRQFKLNGQISTKIQLLKPYQELQNMNKPICDLLILKQFTHTKSPGSDAFTDKFNQIFKKYLYQSFINPLKKIDEENP